MDRAKLEEPPLPLRRLQHHGSRDRMLLRNLPAAAVTTLGATLMNIYWTLKSVPELSGLPLRERGRVWRAVSLKTFRHWEVWVALVVPMGLGVFLGNILSQPIGGMIGAALGGFVFSQVAVHFTRPYLRDYLLSEGEPLQK